MEYSCFTMLSWVLLYSKVNGQTDWLSNPRARLKVRDLTWCQGFEPGVPMKKWSCLIWKSTSQIKISYPVTSLKSEISTVMSLFDLWHLIFHFSQHLSPSQKNVKVADGHNDIHCMFVHKRQKTGNNLNACHWGINISNSLYSHNEIQYGSLNILISLTHRITNRS